MFHNLVKCYVIVSTVCIQETAYISQILSASLPERVEVFLQKLTIQPSDSNRFLKMSYVLHFFFVNFITDNPDSVKRVNPPANKEYKFWSKSYILKEITYDNCTKTHSGTSS